MPKKFKQQYVIAISRCEYNILIIARVQGRAEDGCNNQDIVRAYPGYNWLLSHKPWKRICYPTLPWKRIPSQ